MRIIIPNGIYHVSVRINNTFRWFEDEKVCNLYLSCLYEQKHKNDFKLYSFCLMPTHNHLIIQTNEEIASINKVMHGLNLKFSKEFNKFSNSRGRFWRERYSSRPIDKGNDLLTVLKYIAENPVKSELVKHPLDYKFNSIHSLYTGEFVEILDPLPCGIDKILKENIGFR